MSQIVFKNFSLLDPRWDEARGGYEVLVEGEIIKEVSAKPIKARNAQVVNGGGKRTLMPGLIDCHVHVFLTEVNIRNLESVPLTLLTAKSAELMRGMIDRGFTTVRDTGGADWGIKTAVEIGPSPGPRLFISARAMADRRAQRFAPPHATSGRALRLLQRHGLLHGDRRRAGRGAQAGARADAPGRRPGEDHVLGRRRPPYDPLDSLQFSEAEIAAATDEAKNFGRYVLAHAYTPEAITRAMNNGVRTIEHGNLIDEKSAKLLKSKGGYMIANLVTYFSMKERAAQFGMTADMLAKNDIVLEGALRSLEICKKAGVKVGYGTDLLGALQVDQSLEFIHRAKVLKPIEIIRQATIIGAEILRMDGKLGVVAPGAYADLIAIDGNPLKKLELFLDQGKHLPMIMKAGKFHKNALK